MKRIAIALVLLCLPSLVSAQTVSVPSIGALADSVSVSVSYSGFTGAVALDLQLAYDASQLEIDPVFNGRMGESWLKAHNLKPGLAGALDTLHIAAATALDSIQGSGVLYTLKARLLHPAGSVLVWVNAEANDIAMTTVDGYVRRVGHNGVLSASAIMQAETSRSGWRQLLRISVVDADLSAPPTVQVVNISTGQTMSVATSGSPFSASIPTLRGSGGPTVLGINPGDAVEVRYEDALTSAGGSATRNAGVQVIAWWGDLAGNDKLTVMDASRIYRLANQGTYDPVGDLTGSGTVVI